MEKMAGLLATFCKGVNASLFACQLRYVVFKPTRNKIQN